jgi:hypothetical protein
LSHDLIDDDNEEQKKKESHPFPTVIFSLLQRFARFFEK